MAEDGNRLATASLEELMNVEIQSFARKSQKLSQTAGAVYVITAEDIQRSGATVLPEVLRMVPGLHVARIDTGKWAISARGFSNRYANKMLVLIDGRSVYNTAHGGVQWEEQDLLLQDVERIEVIRGPGATSWGANAVNGVINIITRRAQDTHGAFVSLTAGNEEQRGAWNARWGGVLGQRFHYRISGKTAQLNSMTPLPGGIDPNAWNLGRLQFRGDLELGPGSGLMMQAGFSGMSGDQTSTRAFRLTPSDDWARSPYDGEGRFALLRWRKETDRLDTTLQFIRAWKAGLRIWRWGGPGNRTWNFSSVFAG